MVRATVRTLYFAQEPRNRDEAIAIVMKQWKLTGRRIATAMLQQLNPGMAHDLVANYSFVEKAHRELGASR